VELLIIVVPVFVLFLFILNLFYKGNNVQSCLLFVLTLLPFMEMKITKEAYGGLKVFDAICYYCLVFLLKEFIAIKVKNNIYFLLFLLFSLIVFFGGLASEYPGKTYMQVVKVLSIFIFARFLLTEMYKDNAFHEKVIAALKISYLIALGFLFIQIIIGLKFTLYKELGPNTVDPIFHMVRYPGVFYDSQASGQYLAMSSFLFLFIPEGSPRKVYMFNYTIFLLGIIGMGLAGSRAAIGGFMLGLFIIIFMAAKQYRVYGIVLIVVGFIAYVFVSPSSGVFERAGNLSDDYLFRKSIWTKALDISQDHPYLGIGWGNYQTYVTRHAQDQYLEMAEGELMYFTQPENGYLKILVEVGYLGFFIFLLFLIIPLLKGFIRYIQGVYDRHVIILIASLISWMVAFYTVYSITDYRLLIMVTSLIVLIVSYSTHKRHADQVAG